MCKIPRKVLGSFRSPDIGQEFALLGHLIDSTVYCSEIILAFDVSKSSIVMHGLTPERVGKLAIFF